MSPEPVLSPQQITYFRTFGYLKLPGLFANDADELIQSFEEVFRDQEVDMESYVELHNNDRRRIVFSILSKHPRLNALLDDPRITGLVTQLLGDSWEFADSDGNLFDCESHWHADTYGAPMTQHHLKLSFYLDPLRADSGAIRVIPGTNDWTSEYALKLRRSFQHAEDISGTFGVDPRDIPAVVLESDPGDLILWDYRTIHASYYGNVRRRLFSVSFREIEAAAEATPA
jgi:ectoine hydroxylase-related dioxygenase (phytanoyl-CoA dioxygenase family)